MTAIRLGVGCERKPKVLISGLPANHCCCSAIAAESDAKKGKSVESIVEYEIIQFSRLRLVDDLPRFVESLQGEQACWRDCRTRLH